MELNEIEKELLSNFRKSEKSDRAILSKRAKLFAAYAEKARREGK